MTPHLATCRPEKHCRERPFLNLSAHGDKAIIVVLPFHRGGNGGPERGGHLLEVTQRMHGRDRIRTHASYLQVPGTALQLWAEAGEGADPSPRPHRSGLLVGATASKVVT